MVVVICVTFEQREAVLLMCMCFVPSFQELPESLNDFLLPLTQSTAADLYVIATQESTANRQDSFTHVMTSTSSLNCARGSSHMPETSAVQIFLVACLTLVMYESLYKIWHNSGDLATCIPFV